MTSDQQQPPSPPSKREVMLALLEHAEAQVHLDARRAGVNLPARLLGSGNVRLDYGYGLVPPIPDLVIGEDGIHATLSFNRVPVATFVPWTAVFLIADFAGRGAVWREDLPPELSAQVEADTATGPPLSRTEPEMEAPKPRHLGLVEGEGKPGEPSPEGPPEPPRPRPTLRLVK